MDLLEDPVFKTKYQKSKIRVKLWESDFMENYGRKPNKNDIREADTVIREAYKTYWTLKTRALEETLMDITFSDDVQANISASSVPEPPVQIVEEEIKDPPTVLGDVENRNPEVIKVNQKTEFDAVTSADSVNLNGAWGSHLNNTKKPEPKKKPNLLVGRSSSFQLSQKMFNNTSFTKRNPRKSLSSAKLRTPSDTSNGSRSQSTTDESSQARDGFDPSELLKPMLGDQLKVVQVERQSTARPVSAVHHLLEGAPIDISRRIDSGWLNRCSKQNNIEPIPVDPTRLSGTSDSGIDSLESSLYSPRVSQVNSQVTGSISEDEDFICNSDSEGERKNKRIRTFKRSFSSTDNLHVKRPRIESYSSSQIDSRTAEYEAAGQISKNIDNLRIVADEVQIDAAVNENPPDNEIAVDTNDSRTRDIELGSESHSPREKTIVEEPAAVAAEPNDLQNSERPEEQSPTIKPNSRATRKPYRRIQRKVSDDSYSEEEEDDGDEIIVKTRKPTRATRVTRQRAKVEKETRDTEDDEEADSGAKTEPTKIKATKTRSVKTKAAQPRAKAVKGKATRVSRATKKQPPKEDERKTEQEAPQIPIYGIDTVNAVPRFSLPTFGTGDLINDFACAVDDNAGGTGPARGKAGQSKKSMTAAQRLEKKFVDGNVNENFVRINLKKKIFVRGKKTMTFAKYKKNQWKQKKKELASGEGGLDLADLVEKKGVLTCFKCGDIGHFSRECRALKSDDLLPLSAVNDTSEYPTLQEAENMAKESAIDAHKYRLHLMPPTAACSYKVTTASTKENDESAPTGIDDEKTKLPEDEDNADFLDGVDFSEDMSYEEPTTKPLTQHAIPDELVAKLLPVQVGPVKPLFDLSSNSKLRDTPEEIFEALRMFGHDNFRPGQEKAVMRILSGKSTLVTLSTGSGKSLCYQLPAYLYARHSRCITLVISPLVSLMDDQVTGVPKFLSAACLHTAQSAKQKQTVMDKVKAGTLNILLVSPEAVVAGEKSTGFGALLRQLPPIAFACIDEAHCISQWSHNFRPSYLMVCKVLREKLGVRTVLGLTATATKSTAESIVDYLNIPDGMGGVISDIPLPRNLTLTVSKDEHRDRALVTLMESERFKDLTSIIVYCTRRDECVRLAGLLRTSLWDPNGNAKSKDKTSKIAEAYHAGLPASRRKLVQTLFMKDEIKIVVATVAFGMGINKSDIGAVIHYNMPSSFESYVQEVGRAGRDGESAHCHLFISPKEVANTSELRRHIYANGVDRHMIRRLLQKVFVSCECTKMDDNRQRRCPGHEVAIPVDSIVETLDISQEIISTLLCYLELHPKKFITNLPSAYVKAKVTSYNGPRILKAAAQSSPPLAMAIALDLKRGIKHDDSSVIEFPVVDIASAIGWDSGVVKSHLKNLEWQQSEGGGWKRTPISITFDTLGFRLRAPGDLSDAELDEALEMLTERTSAQQRMSLCQLEAIHSALTGVSCDTVRQCQEQTDTVTSKSDALKTIIRSYFQTDNPMQHVDLKLETKLANEAQIVSDIRSLVHSYRENNFTGRAVARIFHGIQSPNYSALVWSRCRFWRAHLTSNFELICQLATREILAMRA